MSFQEVSEDPKVSVRRVAPANASPEVRSTVIRAFCEPEPYALYKWIAVDVIQDKTDTMSAAERVTNFTTDVILYSLRQNAGSFVLEAREREANAPILGSSLVAYRPGFSSNVFVNYCQKFYRGIVMTLAGLFSVGMPPKGTLNRFMACSEMDDARHRATKEGPHLHLIILATLPEARGKGMGGAMLVALSKYADELGLDIYLETDEPHLRKFYEGFGFICQEEYVLTAGQSVFTPNYAMLRPVKNVVKYN